MGNTFVAFFQKLLTKPKYLEECTRGLDSTVTPNMNQKLTSAFTALEVKMALDQMSSMKAPEPNGFTADFYQQNWATVGPEVCQAVLNFLNGAPMNRIINATNIALIPKSGVVTKRTGYRTY